MKDFFIQAYFQLCKFVELHVLHVTVKSGVTARFMIQFKLHVKLHVGGGLAMLKVIRRLESKLEELFERYCRLSSAMMASTSRADILGGCGYKDTLSTLTAAKIELEAEIQELAGIKARCQSELAAVLVDLIDEPAVRDVIYLRYGCLRRFSEIAAILEITLRKVFRLHKIGIQTITNLHDKSMQKNYT